MTQEQSSEVVEPSAQAGHGEASQDQAEVSQTSSDQAVEQSQEDANLVEVNDEKIPLEELKKGYMRQQDYTRKTTEVARQREELEKLKRQLARQGLSATEAHNQAVQQQAQQAVAQGTSSGDLPEEVQQAVEVLKQAGMVTIEDLAILQAQQEDEKKLQSLLEANPELVKHEKALRAIGQTDDRAWEDIIADYGFMAKDKIVKAKERHAKGYTTPEDLEPKTKSISEMTDEEYEEWKKENLNNGSSPFFSKKE